MHWCLCVYREAKRSCFHPGMLPVSSEVNSHHVRQAERGGRPAWLSATPPRLGSSGVGLLPPPQAARGQLADHADHAICLPCLELLHDLIAPTPHCRTHTLSQLVVTLWDTRRDFKRRHMRRLCALWDTRRDSKRRHMKGSVHPRGCGDGRTVHLASSGFHLLRLQCLVTTPLSHQRRSGEGEAQGAAVGRGSWATGDKGGAGGGKVAGREGGREGGRGAAGG